MCSSAFNIYCDFSLGIYQYNKENFLREKFTIVKGSHLSKSLIHTSIFRTCQLTKHICIRIKATSTISGIFYWWKLALAIQMADIECFRVRSTHCMAAGNTKNCYGHCAHSSSCYVYSVQKFNFRLGSQLGYAFDFISGHTHKQFSCTKPLPRDISVQ